MKSNPAVTSTVLGVATFLALALAEAAETRIDAVTVYPRGAEVTRVARVALTPGSNSVALEGFPGDIDPQRIRVEAGGNQVEVRSVNVDVIQQREAYNVEVRRIESAISKVRADISAIDDDIATAELQLEFLRGLATEYAGLERGKAAGGEANIASWREALQALGEGSGDARERIRNARKSREEAEKDLSVLERKLEDMRGQTAASTRLRVQLVSEAARETDLQVHYFQYQAGWSSRYDAYLDTQSEVLTLVQQGLVWQRTAEKWPKVLLTLSTAMPDGRMQAPRQESRFLDLHDTRDAFLGERMVPRGASGQAAVLGADMAQREMEESLRGPSGRYAVLYAAPERFEVANDADQAREVPLANFRYAAELGSRIAPRQNPQAFVTARVTHENETPLFAGDMRVFLDGSFTGLARLPTLLPDTEAVLPMGPDRKVEVAVIDRGGERGREGLLSARNTQLIDFLFEMTNRHSRPVRMEVIDYYPVPRDERIEVSVPRGADSPAEKDFEDRPGVVAWRKEMAPGESWRILHQYEISYPRNSYLEATR